MKFLVNSFPHEVGVPIRYMVKSEQDFYKFLNTYNKMKHLYFALYECDEGRRYEHTKIPFIFFDFDINEDMTLHDVFEEFHSFACNMRDKHIKHFMTFSAGKGFHMYVFTKNGESLRFPKDALFNAHTYFQDEYDLHSDTHVFGDVARIARVPNSWHLKSKRYCIPITYADLGGGLDFILEKSKKQCFEFVTYGTELVDMKPFDVTKRQHIVQNVPDYAYDVSEDSSISRMLPCVQSWLTGSGLSNHEARFEFGVYCREMGLPIGASNEIAKKYFSAIKGNHGGSKWDAMKRERTLELAYRRDDMFPSCNTLISKGLCMGKCANYSGNNSPIYYNDDMERIS